MIFAFLIVLVVVAGFVLSQHFTFKHIAKLEVLLKAQDLYEAKRYEEQPREEVVEKETSLADFAHDNDPEVVREAFRKGMAQPETQLNGSSQ